MSRPGSDHSMRQPRQKPAGWLAASRGCPTPNAEKNRHRASAGSGEAFLLRLTSFFMRPPPFPHASPLPSFCTVPTPARRTPSLSESLRQIAAWLSGRQPKPTRRERELEERAIERLAEELAEAERAGQGGK